MTFEYWSEAIEEPPPGWKILILTDSQAAIAALRKAGRRGKSRTADLRDAIRVIREKQGRLGSGAVRLGWVTAHVGIPGNERAQMLAKNGAEEPEPQEPQITEGGLKQEWRRKREAERRVMGAGMGRVVGWSRVNYVHCRTGKGNLQAWRAKLDDTVDPTCRTWKRAGMLPWSAREGRRLAGGGGTGKR